MMSFISALVLHSDATAHLHPHGEGVAAAPILAGVAVAASAVAGVVLFIRRRKA